MSALPEGLELLALDWECDDCRLQVERPSEAMPWDTDPCPRCGGHLRVRLCRGMPRGRLCIAGLEEGP
jgi:hypothetical protein